MTSVVAILLAYLIGSAPNGYLVVKWMTGQNLLRVGSGRTGATNAMRAAGLPAGFITACLDIGKGGLAIWVARFLLSGQVWVPSNAWIEAATAIAVVAGHNWSIYIRFRGGAGTGPNVGAAIALWPPAALVLLPFVPVVLFSTGYASVASLTTALLIPALFAAIAFVFNAPWEFVVYGVITFCIVTWSLRSNIERLRKGEERMVGPRADRRLRQTLADQSEHQERPRVNQAK
ncbi:MAG: glycerol-3-phosphate acyltransferase [Rudaea sp.]